MQATRERILRILKETEEATVDELSRELGLTAVTVRHHLDILRGDGLVSTPVVRRRRAPGRPQHVYALTDNASSHFPKLYDQLACLLLDDMQTQAAQAEVDRAMERIGGRLAVQFSRPDGGQFQRLLVAVVDFLNMRGYLASWERADDGSYLLHIANCPYEQVTTSHPGVCLIDLTLLSRTLGTLPQRIDWAIQGNRRCTYRLRTPDGSGASEADRRA